MPSQGKTCFTASVPLCPALGGSLRGPDPAPRRFVGGGHEDHRMLEAFLAQLAPAAGHLHAAKRPYGDGTVVFTAPGAAPVFQFYQFERGLADEIFDHFLVA